MYVSMDTELKGFLFTLTESPLPNPVLVISVERSEIEFLLRRNRVRLVNPPNDDMSDIELPSRASDVRLVNPANDDMSDIELSERNSPVRLVNPPNDDMSDIEFF